MRVTGTPELGEGRSLNQSFVMSLSHGCAATQSFAEFAQNLEMCTPKLEKSYSFIIFTYFSFVCLCTFYVTFRVFFVHFLAQNFQNFCFDSAKKIYF